MYKSIAMQICFVQTCSTSYLLIYSNFEITYLKIKYTLQLQLFLDQIKYSHIISELGKVLSFGFPLVQWGQKRS